MPVEKSQLSRAEKARYRIGNAVSRAAVGAMLALPYRWRVPVTGWLGAHVLGPLAGLNRRIRRNLSLALPEMPPAEARALCRAVCDNAARTTIEQLSTEPFVAQTENAPIGGPGWPAVQEAIAQGRPILICGAHFGNYTAIRTAMAKQGHPVAVVYRRLANPYFNRYYVERLKATGGECFEQGPKGMRGLVKLLRGGGIIGILTDLHAHGGEDMTYFGQPAVTSTATAELALKFDALLVPGYAIRQADGLNFEVVFHDPIPHSDPLTMTQAMTDDLEALVRRHMDQWFWIHRRWKPWVGNGVRRGHPDG